MAACISGLSSLVQAAELAYLGRLHIGVDMQAGAVEAPDPSLANGT
jgi:hypothetical protein